MRWLQSRGQPQTLHVFALDCSASMLENGAFAQAKGLLLQWLRWAYLQRTPVALMCFGAGQVQWRLRPVSMHAKGATPWAPWISTWTCRLEPETNCSGLRPLQAQPE